MHFLARQLHARLPRQVEREDLVSAGTLGLIHACARFTGVEKIQFRSYAQTRIRGAMLDDLRSADWSPRSLRRRGRLIAQTRRDLNEQGIEAPDEKQMAEEMRVPLALYQQLLVDLNGLELESLQVERGEIGDHLLIDLVPSPAHEDPLCRCLQKELRERLIAHIEVLPEKERLVLSLRYYEELTMKEIAEVLGVVGSRVSQLHSSALKRLKAAFRERYNGI